MNTKVQTFGQLSLLVLGVLLLAAGNIFYFIPQIHTLRQAIDGDRASTAIVKQQQSSLAQLSRDVESIKTKQTEMNTHVWLFIKEDDFFTFIAEVTKSKSVTIADPNIADATPTGAILPRTVSFTITGSLTNALAAVTELQKHTPLIALQQLSVAAGKGDQVNVVVTGTTLWK